MLNEIALEVFSKKDFTQNKILENFYNKLFSDISLQPKPDYFNAAEPIKYKVSDFPLEHIISLAKKHHGNIFLKKRGNPKTIFYFSYAPYMKDNRIFYYGAFIRVANKKFSINDFQKMFEFYLEVFEPGYAYITETKERENISYFYSYDSDGNKERYIIPNFPIWENNQSNIRLPSIFWKTFIGKELIEHMGGEKKFETLKAHSVEKRNNGYLITAYEDFQKKGTPETIEAREKIMEHFGRELFFDIKTSHFNSCKM